MRVGVGVLESEISGDVRGIIKKLEANRWNRENWKIVLQSE